MRFNGLKAAVAPMVFCGTVVLFAARPAAAQIAGKPSAQSPTAYRSAAEATYGEAFKGILRDYQNQMRALRQQSQPAPSLPVAERRAIIDSRMNELVSANFAYAQRLDALKPPARFREMHTATRAFFQTSASSLRAFGAAMHKGDRNAAKAALARADRAEQLARKRMVEVRQPGH